MTLPSLPQTTQFFSTKEKIAAWLDKEKIYHYTIREDLSVDVEWDVNLSIRGISKLLFLPVQFGEVKGSFNISSQHLTSLLGCPRVVRQNFICSGNPITSLIGGPSVVEGNYHCQQTRTLVSLEGAPHEIGKPAFGSTPKTGDFMCYLGSFTSFKHGPKIVHGDFDSGHNPAIECLLDAPDYVGGNFFVGDSQVKRIWNMPTRMNALHKFIIGIKPGTKLEHSENLAPPNRSGFIQMLGSQLNDYLKPFQEQKVLNQLLEHASNSSRAIHKI